MSRCRRDECSRTLWWRRSRRIWGQSGNRHFKCTAISCMRKNIYQLHSLLQNTRWALSIQHRKENANTRHRRRSNKRNIWNTTVGIAHTLIHIKCALIHSKCALMPVAALVEHIKMRMHEQYCLHNSALVFNVAISFCKICYLESVMLILFY